MLPTLPDVAIKLQELIDDPNVSADHVLMALSADPFVSAQIIRSANSAAFEGLPQINCVREAASRLGYRQLRNVVFNVTMSNLLYANKSVIGHRIKEIWDHSREMAALSYVIALRHSHLSPEHAMIIGLVHDIGVLPLYLHIEKNNISMTSDDLEILINECHEAIGAKLLEKWKFPQDIVEAVAEHDDIHREHDKAALPDYADVIMFANLQGSGQAKRVTWANVAAVSRLGFSERECQTFLEHNADRIKVVKSMLGMTPPAKFHAYDDVTPPG